MRLILTLYYVLCTSYNLDAQFREVGTWRYYFNAREYKNLENINGNLFVNAQRVLFDVELESMEVSTLDRTKNLADYNISTMAYSDSAQKLIVAYANTIIDVIDFKNGKQKTTPNYDINTKLLVADKTILSIKFYNGKAYLCTKIGIIVFDYNKNEIVENFIIGNGGNMTAVYTLEILNDTIIASTDEGIKKALIHPAINLQNYSNWTTITSLPNDSILKSVHVNNQTYWMSQHSLYQFSGNSFATLISRDTLHVLKQIKWLDNALFIIYDSLDDTTKNFKFTVVKKWINNQLILHLKSSDKLNDISKNNNGNYFFSGQVLFEQIDQNLKRHNLSSYPFDNPFRMQFNNKDLIINMGVLAKNLDANLNGDGHFGIQDNWWYHSGLWDDSLRGCTNQLSAINRDGGLYRNYARGGVSFQKEGQPTLKYNRINSTLDTLNHDGKYRTSDMVLNPKDSSIWITSQSSKNPLHCLTISGQWYSFDLLSVSTTNQIYKIIIDNAGNKWLLTRADGVIMFNEMDINNTSDNIVRQFKEFKKQKNPKANDCAVSVSNPYCAVVDKSGFVWVGSEKGVGAIVNCTEDPTLDCEFYVPNQSIINNLNDTITECVFLNTAVTAMAVDGGNHLWLGTSDGLFYEEEQLNSEFIRLNKLNSPFTAKSVYDIKVHPVSGEVFVSSEIGLISFMGQSIEAKYNDELDPYRIIPNPVSKDYQGLISIDGLAENSYYKITDVIGNLVYQGQSNGSRVTWDLKSLNGIRVSTGVYYIFSGNNQLIGKTGVGKFTVIR